MAESEEENATQVEQRIGVGNPILGKSKIQTENCQECHGEFGVGLSASAPKLTGQYADYIVKQLKNFQSGERKHPVMTVMAENLSDEDRADIAAYFASNPTMIGDGSGFSVEAQNLFQRGDATRNIPACKSCHGETGRGKYSATESYPAIAGQHRIYLREQLLNWRGGGRKNSPSGVMNFVTNRLTDGEIEALASYLSGL